ncbi:MAG: hypothetical protein ABIK31_04965 [candidate division WOR-3 bacterium]
MVIIYIIISFFIASINNFVFSQSTENQGGLCNAFGCNNYTDVDVNLGSILSFIASLVFIAIIILGVVKIILAVYKIISSEGNADSLSKGRDMIKAVWVGIAIIFLGLIGLLIIIAIFNAGSIFNVDPNSVLPRGFRGELPF